MPDLAKMRQSLVEIIDEADSLHKLGQSRSLEQTNRLKALVIGTKDDRSDALIEISRRAFDDAQQKEDEHLFEKAILDSRNSVQSKYRFPGGGSLDERLDHQKRAAAWKPERLKSLGETLITDPRFLKALRTENLGDGRTHVFKFTSSDDDHDPLKAVMTTSNGYQPATIRLDRDTDILVRQTACQKIIPYTMGVPKNVDYMKQTVRTSAAAPRLEGGLPGQSTRNWVPVSHTCQSVSQYQPLTRDQVNSAPQLKSVVDRQLLQELWIVEESQIVNGNGTAPNIQGIRPSAGVQTYQAPAGQKKSIALRKAINQLETTSFRFPTGILIHPNDLMDMELETDSNGQFLLSHPLLDVTKNWMVPIYKCLEIAEGEALIGDFYGSAERMIHSDYAIEVGLINDDFVRNQLCVKIELIMTLCLYRPNAFCKVDFTP